MNLVRCAEPCRWQQDGLCTLCDFTRADCLSGACSHFESTQSIY